MIRRHDGELIEPDYVTRLRNISSIYAHFYHEVTMHLTQRIAAASAAASVYQVLSLAAVLH